MSSRMTLDNGEVVSVSPIPGGAMLCIGNVSRFLGISEMRDLGKDLLIESAPDRALREDLRKSVRRMFVEASLR